MGGKAMTRRRLTALQRARIFDAARPVFMVECSSCGEAFDRGYRISTKRAGRPQYCSAACQTHGKSISKVPVSDRFWTKVDVRSDAECWEWTGHRRPSGYGWFNFDGQPMNASRAAYIITHGPIAEGLVVCHSCDNPPCCNPAHLWPGSTKENAMDMVQKGRARPCQKKGEDHASAILSEENVRHIRASAEGATVLGRRFGVTPTAIYNIRKRLTWRHI